jgi:hypothetical protein
MNKEPKTRHRADTKQKHRTSRTRPGLGHRMGAGARLEQGLEQTQRNETGIEPRLKERQTETWNMASRWDKPGDKAKGRGLGIRHGQGHEQDATADIT